MGLSTFKCVICGNMFESAAHNAKYCSVDCQVKGRDQRRKKWEISTNYHEKQRQKMQAYRDKQAAETKAAEEKAKRNRSINKKRQDTRRKNMLIEKLTLQAEQGDEIERSLAKKQLALYLHGNTSVEYWEAWKEYQEQYNKQNNLDNVLVTVNSIALSDPNFAISVSISIEELGSIKIESTFMRQRKQPQNSIDAVKK